jgi:hypothetical protein
MFHVGTAEVFIYLIPAAVGIATGRVLRSWANLAVMVAVLYLDVTIMIFQTARTMHLTGPFALVLISPAGWLPILSLLLIARLVSRKEVS